MERGYWLPPRAKHLAAYAGFMKNFILRSSKSGGCQDDFFGLVSSFKLPHNG